MIEISSVHGRLVTVYGYISPYRSPQSHTVYGNDIFRIAIHVANKKSETPGLIVGTVQHESGLLSTSTAFIGRMPFPVYYLVGKYYAGIFRRHVIIAYVVDVKSREYLPFLVKSHIDILYRLQCLKDKSQQKSHHDNHHSTV